MATCWWNRPCLLLVQGWMQWCAQHFVKGRGARTAYKSYNSTLNENWRKWAIIGLFYRIIMYWKEKESFYTPLNSGQLWILNFTSPPPPGWFLKLKGCMDPPWFCQRGVCINPYIPLLHASGWLYISTSLQNYISNSDNFPDYTFYIFSGESTL